MRNVVQDKNNSLQVLRALAFLCVFTSHVGLTYFGGIGVEIFLILSGYLLTNRYLEKDQFKIVNYTTGFKFAIKKILPLYHLHITMTLVAVPILILNNWKQSNRGLRIIIKILINIGLLQSWVPIEEFRYSMNNLSWYLSVCVFLYFMFPYVLAYLRKEPSRKKIYWYSLLTVILQVVVGATIGNTCGDAALVQGLTYNFPIYRLGDFLIGCNLGYLCHNKKMASCITPRLMLFFSITTFAATEVVVYQLWENPVYTWCKNTVFLLPAACVLVLTFSRIQLSETKVNKALVKLGDLSVYTYLIHELIIRYINIFLTRVVHLGNSIHVKLTVGCVSFILTIMLSMLYQHIKKAKYETRKN